MFEWRDKRYGVWLFACKNNSKMFYNVKFYHTTYVKPLNAIPPVELYLILIERGCFTFTASVHSLLNSISYMFLFLNPTFSKKSSCIPLEGLDTPD